MQETQVQSLGWEDPQEKEMATHSNIFAWCSDWVISIDLSSSSQIVLSPFYCLAYPLSFFFFKKIYLF